MQDTVDIKQYKVTIVAAVHVHRNGNWVNFDVTWVSVLATEIDPRFYQLKFLTDKQRTMVKPELLRIAEEVHV